MLKKVNYFFLIFLLLIFFLPIKAYGDDVVLPGGDIAIEGISIYPNNPDAFQDVTITVTAKNIGTSPLDATIANLYKYNIPNFNFGGITMDTPAGSSIQPNQTIVYTIRGSFTTKDSQSMSFAVDPDNVIPEKNESNNSQALTIVVKKWDLAADSIAVNPLQPSVNQDCVIIVKIKNNGTINLFDSTGFTGYTYSFQDFKQERYTVTLPTILNYVAPGSFVQFNFYGKFSSEGKKDLKFTIDPKDDLKESDLTNNTLEKQVTVISDKDINLSVSSIELNTTKPIIYTPVTVTVKIKNTGLVSLVSSAGFLDIDIKRYFSGYTISNSTHSNYPTVESPLKPGDEFKYTYDGQFYNKGIQNLSFTVDKDNRLNRINNTDNTKSVDVKVYLDQAEADEFNFSNINIANISSTSIRISWHTDVDSTGKAIYWENFYEAPQTEIAAAQTGQDHSVDIAGLVGGKEYRYKIFGTRGNTTKLIEPADFKTISTDSINITSAPQFNINNAKASTTVSWKTDNLGNSYAYYKKSGDKDFAKTGSEDLTASHSVNIDNLSDGDYIIYVSSKIKNGPEAKSSENTITVKKSLLTSPNPSSPTTNPEQTESQTTSPQPVNNQGTNLNTPVFATTTLASKIEIKNPDMYKKLKGKIILEVEKSGQAYYVNPKTQTMLYLGRPQDAFGIMRQEGVGITNKDLEKIPIGIINKESGVDADSDGLPDLMENAIGTDKNKADSDNDGHNDKEEIMSGYNPSGSGKLNIDQNFANKQKGVIFLQVQNNGEAWYVNPADGKRYFLGRPQDAFNAMRYLGLGIGNNDFSKL